MSKSISSKLIYQVSAISVVVLVIAFFVLNYLKGGLFDKVYIDTKNELHISINDKLDKKLNSSLLTALSIANDNTVKESLEIGDRQIALKHLQKLWKTMPSVTNNDKVKIHIHDKNIHSFIRNWKADKFGDDLSGFRHTVIKVNKDKVTLKTIEAGRSGLVLRGMAPITANTGEHLGSVEIIRGFDDVAKDLKKDNRELIVLMDKKLAKLGDLSDTSKSVDKYVLSVKKFNKDLFANLKTINFTELLTNGFIANDKYFITYKYIKDFSGNKIGLYIVAQDIKILNATLDKTTDIVDYSMILTTLLIIIILVTIVLSIKNTVSQPLELLKDSFEKLTTTNDPNIRIETKRDDEIGRIVNVFNAYMDKISQDAKQDAIVIEEVSKIVEKANKGFYNYKIESNAASQSVEKLKHNINKMTFDTNKNLARILNALVDFGNSDFTSKIDDNETSGVIGSLEMGANAMADSLSEFLALIHSVNVELEKDTVKLSTISESLSVSSNKQAASLEETSASLEQITSTIENTTERTIEMDNIVIGLRDSANEGSKLAEDTAKAMDEITQSTSRILESIEVIDQIAFQTNILSLNAAVEAATAGESGKGFAVVAGEVRNLAGRSAEAAREIKEIVDEANEKAKNGKDISYTMNEGFMKINDRIQTTSKIVDDITEATKEQKIGIVQINDAIASLDTATQQNAQSASEVSDKAMEVHAISERLKATTGKAKFDKSKLEQVCDIDLVFDTAKLKFDHILFKQNAFETLIDNKGTKVKTHSECSLAQYMDTHKNNNKLDSNLKEKFSSEHQKLHEMVQKYLDISKNNRFEHSLDKMSEEIEAVIKSIFDYLDLMKKYNCKDMLKGHSIEETFQAKTIEQKQTKTNATNKVDHTKQKKPTSFASTSNRKEETWETF
jgi:methyl-accepting chemotaxis protein